MNKRDLLLKESKSTEKRASETAISRARLQPGLLPLLPGMIFIIFFFLWPLGQMVVRSFTDPSLGFENYLRFFNTTADMRSLVTTMKVSFISTIICAVVGYIYAYTMTLSSPRLSRFLMVAIVLPMGINLLVRTFALQAILRDTGVINTALMSIGLISEPLPLIRNDFAVALGIVTMLLPYMVLPTYSTMTQIDKQLLLAAEGLGATPSKVFWNVFFPLSMPGVTAGSLIVFVSSLGFYVVPSLLGSGNDLFISQSIYFWVRNRGEFGYGSALSVVLLLLTMGTLLIASRFIQIDKAVSQTTVGNQ